MPDFASFIASSKTTTGIIFGDDSWIFGQTDKIYGQQLDGHNAAFLINLEKYRLTPFFKDDFDSSQILGYTLQPETSLLSETIARTRFTIEWFGSDATYESQSMEIVRDSSDA